MPRGGRREGAGRPVGSVSKTAAELKALAQQHGPAIIAKLASMAGLGGAAGAESEQAQLGALRELLDRGYGRPPQAVTGEDGAPLRYVILAPEPVATTQDWLRLHAPRDVIDGDAEDADADPGCAQSVWPPNNPCTGLGRTMRGRADDRHGRSRFHSMTVAARRRAI